MPAKDGIRCDNGRQFPQCLTSQGIAFYGQQTALFVSQKNAFLALGLHQGSDLRILKLDDLLLSAVSPTRCI